VKIYLAASAEFKKRLRYIAGDRRFARIPSSTRDIVNLWVQKEFKNLQLAEAAGIRVPKPFAFNENVLDYRVHRDASRGTRRSLPRCRSTRQTTGGR
jgi:serine/threonine-protein kinase RIO1